jgi:two-component system, NtrC family, nitrogen regulation response regulator GlnG
MARGSERSTTHYGVFTTPPSAVRNGQYCTQPIATGIVSAHVTIGETTNARGKRGPAQTVSSVPALTILWHPDSSRVGERALLPDLAFGGSAEVSRSTPLFGPPDAAPSRPLADQSVSRTPLEIRTRDDGFTLSCAKPGELRLGAEALRGEQAVPESALAGGVVIQLSGDVSLVMHRATPHAESRPALGFIGLSDVIERVREQVLSVAPHDVPVLLLGESGTGKELAARALHDQSTRRSGRAFASTNLAALSSGTAASELFGHRKGAFTGAAEDKKGYFELADRGTLFLDEIGCAPPELQAALLRVLETGEVPKLGASSQPRVDARVISATDTNLERAVAQGRFSLALLHRLRGYQIRLPALRERREDIGVLLRHFLQAELAHQGRSHLLDVRPGADAWLSSAIVAELALHDFPGNVRELRNVARQLAIDWGSRPRVELASVSALLAPSNKASPEPARHAPPEPKSAQPASTAEVLAAWEQAGWNVGRVADVLKLSRTTVYEILRRAGYKTAADLTRSEIEAQLEAAGGDLEKAAHSLRVTERALRLRLTQLG